MGGSYGFRVTTKRVIRCDPKSILSQQDKVGSSVHVKVTPQACRLAIERSKFWALRDRCVSLEREQNPGYVFVRYMTMSKHDKLKQEKAARNELYSLKFKKKDKTARRQERKLKIKVREERLQAQFEANEAKAKRDLPIISSVAKR